MPVKTPGVVLALALWIAQCCIGAQAMGVLKLSDTELTLAPGDAGRELYVENAGDTPLYLEVTQQLVTNPGKLPERLLPVGEIRHPGLLVLPNRLKLEPGQRYRIALTVLETSEHTQVWRVTFRPKEHIVIDDEQRKGDQPPLFVSIGYGVVIYQLGSDRGGPQASPAGP